VFDPMRMRGVDDRDKDKESAWRWRCKTVFAVSFSPWSFFFLDPTRDVMADELLVL
jgi:hypothetical protein